MTQPTAGSMLPHRARTNLYLGSILARSLWCGSVAYFFIFALMTFSRWTFYTVESENRKIRKNNWAENGMVGIVIRKESVQPVRAYESDWLAVAKWNRIKTWSTPLTATAAWAIPHIEESIGFCAVYHPRDCRERFRETRARLRVLSETEKEHVRVRDSSGEGELFSGALALWVAENIISLVVSCIGLWIKIEILEKFREFSILEFFNSIFNLWFMTLPT